MGLYRVFYAGIFEGKDQNEAEVYASSHRGEMMHLKTVPTQEESKNDDEPKELKLFATDESIRELIEGLEDKDGRIDPRIDDLDFDTLFLILRKDCMDGDLLIQTAIKGYTPKERVAVIYCNPFDMMQGEDKLSVVHCIPSFVGTEMANYLKIKTEKENLRRK